MQIIYTKVAQTKKGNRIFFEGKKLASLGFSPTSRYTIHFNKENGTIELSLNDNGDKIVSKRTRYNEELPVIDICNQKVTDFYPEGTKIVIRVKENKIIISEQEVQKNQVSRERTFVAKVQTGLALSEGSLCTGGGISTHAIHSAFNDSGIKADVKMIAELDERYLQVAHRNFPNVEVVHQCKIEEVEFQDIPKLDILSFSLPCTGHSIAGKTKNKITTGEEHTEAATSVFGALRYIVKSNPTLLISENVTQARESATYTLLKAELNRIGYRIEEFILDETQAGSLEKRRRYWFVGISKGLEIENIIPQSFERVYKTVGEIVDNNVSGWFPLDYFDKRNEINKEHGRGFKKNLVTVLDNGVTTILRNYTKRQISNPHFSDGEKIRLFTTAEHARLKGIPEHLIEGVVPTVGHEILGQSILYNHAYGIIKGIAKQISFSLKIKQDSTQDEVGDKKKGGHKHGSRIHEY